MNTKTELIKKMKKEANKAISKVIENAFDTNERNRLTLQIHQILAHNIKKLETI
jgi:formate dehydrogenase maturation protein FdhE